MRLVVAVVVLAFAVPRDALAEPLVNRERHEMVALAFTIGGIALSTKLVAELASDNLAGPTAYLALAGAFVLPSAGHLYAEDWLWTGIGVGSRLAALALIARGDRIEREPAGCHPDFDVPCERTGTADKLMKAGVVLVVASLVVELFHSPYSAYRFNRKHQLTVSPTAMGSGGAGVAFGGRF